MLIDSSAKLQQLQINDHQENVEEPLDDKSSLELCLSTMSQSLKQDICDLRKPDAVLGEVGPERILKATPEELRYACRRWSDHLQAEMNDASLDKIEEFLNKHVLHWIEAMTLIGSISKCIRTLRQLHSTVSVSSSSALFVFISNICRPITLIAKHCPPSCMTAGASFSETVLL